MSGVEIWAHNLVTECLTTRALNHIQDVKQGGKKNQDAG